MTYRTDADFLQVLLGQVRKDPFVDLVLAECRLVFFEAQAPQPDHNVHDGRPTNSGVTSSSGASSVSRVALGFSGFANRAEVYGITSLGSIHDSLGCLPSDAERFRRIIR
jgi:hypothetical protein